MDKLNIPRSESTERAGGGLRAMIAAKLREAKEERRQNKLAPAFDVLSIALGLIFSRCHIIFGSHPLAIAFIAVLPSRVWLAALGSALGAFSLGKSGLIYAMISAIVVFLRMIVSGTDKREGHTGLFGEGILLRSSAALIGGFIAAVYEILLSGFSATAVSFGASMILLSPICTFALSGLFVRSVEIRKVIFTREPVLSLEREDRQTKAEKIFFQSSALLFSFLISIALAEYNLIGINLSYIYAGVATLLVARRFGALRAGALGFVSTLGLSSLYSVAFGLAGLASGALFSLGTVYAFLGGGVALGAWCAYAGGLSGFLSAIPEYMIAALLSAPMVRKLSGERREEKSSVDGTTAEDMLGTMSLSYKNKYTGSLSGLEPALSGISSVMRKYSEDSLHPTRDEEAELIAECVKKYCTGCGVECDGGEIPPELAERLSERLVLGAGVTAADFDGSPLCEHKEALASAINRASALLAEEKYKFYQKDTASEDFSLIAKLLSEARSKDREEKSTNGELTSVIDEMLPELGLTGGVARVLGVRRPYFLIASGGCEDIISSPELPSKIEAATGRRLGKPELYKRGNAVLFAAASEKKLRMSYAIEERASGGGEVSGDTAICFESGDGRFHSLISDGMGSGREAKSVSLFVTDMLSRSLEFSQSSGTLLSLLNHMIARRNEECSATVDLFSLDLLTGEAAFFKSGAAASYIKRGGSLFRIRSKTAPLGLMKTLDAERIKVEVMAGDIIVMISDGVSQNTEDTPWLIELLSKDGGEDIDRLTKRIISEAEAHQASTDDMTVVVAKIEEV